MQHGANHAPRKSPFRLCGRLFVPGGNRAAFSGHKTACLNETVFRELRAQKEMRQL